MERTLSREREKARLQVPGKDSKRLKSKSGREKFEMNELNLGTPPAKKATGGTDSGEQGQKRPVIRGFHSQFPPPIR